MTAPDIERVLAMVMADPGRARAQAADLLTRARRSRDPAAQAMALRALGLACRELHDGAAAVRQLRRSIGIAQRHGLRHLAGESRMSLALVLDDVGRPRAALQEIDRALTCLDGLPLARARMQRGILLRRVGREAEALDAYGVALSSFRRHGDRLWQARALTNRGVLQAYRGGLRQARADLGRAEDLYRELGLTAAVAQVQHNLGFVAAQGGQIPSALDWYDRADEHFQRSGGRPAIALIDRADLLLAARLLPEAKRAAQDAVAAAEAARLGSLLSQARLLLAQATLAAGDCAAARDSARLARQTLRRQHGNRWAVLARYLELRSSAKVRPAALRAIAPMLEQAGFTEQAVEALALAAAQGDRRALGALDRVDPRSGPVRTRIRGWHARALSRLHQGDRAAAKRALLAGFRLLDRYRAAFGATELRVLSSAEGADLAALGMRLALDDRAPRQVLAWAERWRAATLRLRPPPPRDDDLIRDLARLRRVVTELADGREAAHRQRLLHRQRRLEEAIRARTWRASGDQSGVDAAAGSVDSVVDALGDRALLELVMWEGRLLGVVAAAGRVHVRPLAGVAEVDAEVGALRFAMRRLILRHGSPASLDAADAAARHALRALDGLLIAPVRRLLGERELVIVPTGALLALPWSALPGCSGRPVTVAPSATAWLRAATASPDAGRRVLIAAYQPEHAIPEVETLSAHLPGSRVLSGARATVQRTLSAIDGAGCVHVAAHGAFRADNPLFSHLSLADGPLTVHDLTTMRRAPALMVLSACDTGLSAVHPGDELMGLTATVLSAGTRTLIGSIGPVRDSVTRELMVRLHRHLHAGMAPAAALAAARQDTPQTWATEHSFVCFGAGTR